ncbi:MAG: hypothetical protein AB7Q81_00725 [Gammaproteobacteria bacterium]
MTLLVTTTRALWCVDPATTRGYRVDDANGSYYGITHDDDAIYVAARRSGYAAGKQSPRDQRGVILVFDAALELQDTLIPPFALRDLHQLYCFDGALWAVCTYGDAIAVLRDGQWDLWHPLGAPADAGGEPYHFNSIHAAGDVIYVAGSVDRVGAVWAFDRGDRRYLRSWRLGYGTHNVWDENGEIHVLSSLAGCELDGAGQARAISPGNFVRGAALGEAWRWYGISTRAKRDDRETSDAMLLGIAVANGARRHLNLRGDGMVHEIRIPGTLDRAHPAHRGPQIDLTALRARCEAQALDGPACLPARADLGWLAEAAVQKLDRCRRWWHLRRDPAIVV